MKKLSKYLVLGVAFFLVSFAITVQVRITNDSSSTASQEKIATKLKDEIFELNSENEKLERKLDSLDKSLETIRNKASENDSSNLEKSNLIKKYTIEEMARKALELLIEQIEKKEVKNHKLFLEAELIS